MTGPYAFPTRLWPERPDQAEVVIDPSGEFVVDWQVAAEPVTYVEPSDVRLAELLFP